MKSVEDIFNFVENEIEIRIVSLKIKFDNIGEQLVNEFQNEIRTKAIYKEVNIFNKESLFRLNYILNFESYKIGKIINFLNENQLH